MKYLIIGIGGFLGANARYIVGTWVAARHGGADFPYGTLLVNVSGCFILGLFATLALRLSWSEESRLLIAVGFVGAYTTFSTFEFETLQLLAGESKRWGAAVANLGVSVVLGFLAAVLGIALARLLLALSGWLAPFLLRRGDG